MDIRTNFNRNSLFLMLASLLLIALLQFIFLGQTDGLGVIITFLFAFLGCSLVAVFGGPWAGALMGAGYALTGAATGQFTDLEWPLGLMISFFALGAVAQLGAFRTWWSAMATGFMMFYLGEVLAASLLVLASRPDFGQAILGIAFTFLGAIFSGLGFAGMFAFLLIFWVIRLPLPAWKRLLMSLPQAHKVFPNAEEPTPAVKMFGNLAKIAAMLALLAFVGFYLIWALAVGAL